MPPEVPTHASAHVWGKWLLILICITVALSAAYLSLFPEKQGDIRVVIRDASGVRSVYNISIPRGTKTEVTDVDPATISTVPSHIFRLTDGSIITLDDTGVITRQGNSKGPLAVLISSTARPTAQTPIAVWGNAEKIAWVNPADQSLQVFERTARGTYSPIFLDSKTRVNSLSFTEDGMTLVIAQVNVAQGGTSTTQLFSINLSTTKVAELTSLTGFATIVQ